MTGSIECIDSPARVNAVGAGCKNQTACCQRLLLVWSAVGPSGAAKSDFLLTEEWSTANLTLQYLLREPSDAVQVTLSKSGCTAALEFTSQPELHKVQQIPFDLLQFEVGAVLVEMTSRIFLGHT